MRLEYENVILYNFLSRERAPFNHIAAGVSAEDLDADLAYARTKDKADKTLEVYKFFAMAFPLKFFVRLKLLEVVPRRIIQRIGDFLR